MSCFEGHMPRMTEAQLRQAIDAYLGQYEAAWRQQWSASPWTRDIPLQPPRPRRKEPTALTEARPGDKVDAIDVEFVRVR